MRQTATRRKLPFVWFGAGSFVLALFAGWSSIAARIDNYHYDFLLALHGSKQPAQHSVILEIDDATLQRYGRRSLRATLARALERVAQAQPKVVAVDLIYGEAWDPADDAALARAFASAPNLVLSADILPDGQRWQLPYGPFRTFAKAVGHVHADPDRYDGVSRQVQLEKVAGRMRLWALALEAYRLSLGVEQIIESPKDLQLGQAVIPIPRHPTQGRALLILYRASGIPKISVQQILEQPHLAENLRNKVVFAGVTSQSETRDRLMTPVSTLLPMPGVEIHAHIFETLAGGKYLRQASNVAVLVVGAIFSASTAAMFALFGGWQAYLTAILQILLAHLFPHLLFREGVVFPLLAPAACAWLTGLSCAAWEYFVVRKQLRKSEDDRRRYQQAIHFVAHEMKSPLTAIQGMSELIGRYNLSEEKRKHLAQTIHSDSKRMAKMMQAFLDVERLSEGQMEMKREPFAIQDVVTVCVERVRPLGDRKQIRILLGEQSSDEVLGDRELMEYAIYNLLTNAVKYSPAETEVRVDTRRCGEELHVSVRDQGMGMDEKELKQIGTKFYRTRRAEQSGESGTGIGLSIVRQIVEHHGGRLEVTSALNQGSCFTIAVPVCRSAQTTGQRG
ncbi:MAG: CHASE2 and HATPase_c domain-containing protein [Bryobacteraceae bacterium]|nr:CHASE2 and HATPase_c domain-containing protein [Bryobacteraceae bacterium]MDW8377711.1 CHASE2 domain-containing protein [Bryobacterales bacterium]